MILFLNYILFYGRVYSDVVTYQLLYLVDVILNRLEEYLWTSDNHFWYKSGHSSDLCVYALTELIEYYKGRSTSMYSSSI